MADHTILIVIVLIILAILSVLVFVLGVYGVFGNAKKRKLNYLKENGEIIEAEITDFKSYTASMSQAIYVRIVAGSFGHGKPKEFKSERIYPNKCKLDVGDKVKILVNMKNPKQYYFDPYQKEY